MSLELEIDSGFQQYAQSEKPESSYGKHTLDSHDSLKAVLTEHILLYKEGKKDLL